MFDLSNSTTYNLRLDQKSIDFLYEATASVAKEQKELGGSEFGDKAEAAKAILGKYAYQ